jgi:hypothetical protein
LRLDGWKAEVIRSKAALALNSPAYGTNPVREIYAIVFWDMTHTNSGGCHRIPTAKGVLAAAS